MTHIKLQIDAKDFVSLQHCIRIIVMTHKDSLKKQKSFRM